MRELISAKRQEEEQKIDLTPMLDVVFIMLIFFIVTASFIKEAGINVNRPESTTWEKVKNQNILIAISATDEVWIDKSLVELRTVKSVVERMHAENPKGAAVIQADDESTAGVYAEVVDAVKKAGVSDIKLATTEK